MLNKEEVSRYHRHLILEGFGQAAQEKLKQAKVLVIGAGGLGSPVLQYLSAAGIGIIGIIDPDTVDESNLQRQVLYSTEDIGKHKVEVAAKKLSLLNPHIHFITYKEKLTVENSLDIIKEFDVIIDGSDNFPTRYLVNDACMISNKPWVFGSIFRFQGQLTVFNHQNGPSYRCLYPEPPLPGEVPDCSEAGVLGVLPGLIGMHQANECIKMITGIGKVLSGSLLCVDMLSMEINKIEFERDEDQCRISALGNYEEFCGITPSTEIKEISVKELNEQLLQKKELQLLDIREENERNICSLGGIHIEMGELKENLHLIEKNKPVVVYCHHGIRSSRAIFMLQNQFSFNNLLNLKGGIDAWAKQIDPYMKRY